MLDSLRALAVEAESILPGFSWEAALPEYVEQDIQRLRLNATQELWRERAESGGWTRRYRSGACVTVDAQGYITHLAHTNGSTTRIEYRSGRLYRIVGPADGYAIYSEDGLHWNRWEIGQAVEPWVGRIDISETGDIVYRYPSGVRYIVRCDGGRLVVDRTNRVRSIQYPSGLQVELTWDLHGRITHVTQRTADGHEHLWSCHDGVWQGPAERAWQGQVSVETDGTIRYRTGHIETIVLNDGTTVVYHNAWAYMWVETSDRRVTEMVEPRTGRFRMAYDRHGRLHQLVDPFGVQWHRRSDCGGWRASDGRVLTFDIDLTERLPGAMGQLPVPLQASFASGPDGPPGSTVQLGEGFRVHLGPSHPDTWFVVG